MHFSFSKYHGAGNDFILVDNRLENFPAEDSLLIARLCRRRFGIGADGLILLQNSSRADYWMRMFNADGKEVEMCGNGLRCFLQFLKDIGEQKEEYHILVGGDLFVGSVGKDHVVVQMNPPRNISWNIHLSLESGEIFVHHINTGVPHTVVFVDDVNTIDVEALGREIRWHPVFQPKGTNVNFVSFSPEGELHVRTYERGVEGETLACGTGAVASAYAAAKMRGVVCPIPVRTRSQEILTVRSNGDGCLELSGQATYVFKGYFSQKALCCINV